MALALSKNNAKEVAFIAGWIDSRFEEQRE